MEKYLDKNTLRKIQLLELKCLDELKRICEKNNINYFLIGGTLIGAARHQGFIPWDDDIDIGMLREDYDKFIAVCQNDLNTTDFFLQTTDTEKNCCDYEIARIRLNNTHFVQEHRKNLKLHDGIFIEIIPYDALPENDKECKRYYFYFKYMKRILGIRKGYRYEISTKIYKRALIYITAYLSCIIPFKCLEKNFKQYHLKYNDQKSKYVFLLAGAYNYKKEKHLRETVMNYSTLKFEGKDYPVPLNYDLFLSEQYGDYMTPPPVEKQINKCVVNHLDFGPYKQELENINL